MKLLHRYVSNTNALELNIGDWDLSTRNDGNSIKMNPEKIIPHKGYSRSTLQNDIALIKLPKELIYTDKVSPICIPNTGGYLLTCCKLKKHGYNCSSTADSKFP